MNARQRRVARRAADRIAAELEAWAACQDIHHDYDDDDEDRTCEACAGSGGDPMNDGITPCEVCDGEGYKWWL